MKFFDFKGHQFTALTTKKGDPWFVLKEMCDYLEIKSVKETSRRIPPLWKKMINIPELATQGRGGDNSVSIIENEEGANRLVAKSTKPLAQ